MLPPGLGACAGGGAAAALVAAALHYFAAAHCRLEPPYPPAPPADRLLNGSRFDFIVVGGGTAGCALAARLARLTDLRVLLLEAGPDPPLEAVIPGFASSLQGSRFDWNFTTEYDGVSGSALQGGRQLQPRGKMLGGSGSLNSMVYARGFPRDYDEWALSLGAQWGWDAVLPYFKLTERMTDPNIVRDPELMRYHGRAGDLEVSGSEDTFHEIERFLDAFQEVGFDIVDDMTYPHRLGAGRFSHTVRAGTRDSSLTALLNKVDSDNLLVLRDALVTRVLIDNLTATGVRAVVGGDELVFHADREVIVTAGTFNTAKLLMLSGVGPREHLERLGVPVLADLPVGRNLHDHVMFLNFISAERGTCDAGEASAYLDMMRYLYDGGGRFARADSAGALLALNGSEPGAPDFAFYPSCAPVASGFYEGCRRVLGLQPAACRRLDDENRSRELISVAVVLLKPASRGEVRLRSADPLQAPLILPGTFSAPADLAGFPAAVDVVHALAATRWFRAHAARVLDLRPAACAGLAGAARVRCAARALGTAAWHAVGTAALGGVLDPALRVRGVRALRVADASAVPAVPRGNTNAPVIMIAERAAALLAARHAPAAPAAPP